MAVYYQSGPPRLLDWLTEPAHPLAEVLDWYALALADQGWTVLRQQDERLGGWLAFERGSLNGTVVPANYRSPETMHRRTNEFAVNLLLLPATLTTDG